MQSDAKYLLVSKLSIPDKRTKKATQSNEKKMCTLGGDECDIYSTHPATKSDQKLIVSGSSCSGLRVLCKKCKYQDASLLLRDKTGYCETCFLSVSMHKFRATLAKSRAICQNDSVLVGHSGKPNSTVLLHLIKIGSDQSVGKRLSFRCNHLYIDDGIVKGRTIEERKSILLALSDEARNIGSTGYVVPLKVNEICSEDIRPLDRLEINDASDDLSVQEIFQRLKSDTARDELLRQLRRNLLISVAQKLGCTKIFLADTSSDIAAKVLEDISTGRSNRLSVDVGLSDVQSLSGVTLLRPLREFASNELANYLNSHQLNPVFNSEKSNQQFPTSIRNVAQDFIYRLNFEFNSTVSTIYRTSEKVASNILLGDDNNSDACILCKVVLERPYLLENEQISAERATAFSKLISIGSNPLNDDDDADDDQLNYKRERKVDESRLCYGCKSMFSNIDDETSTSNSTLPLFFSNLINKR